VHRHCRGAVVVAAHGGSAARPRREAGGFRRSSDDEEAHPGKEGGGLVGSGLPLLLLDFAQGLLVPGLGGLRHREEADHERSCVPREGGG